MNLNVISPNVNLIPGYIYRHPRRLDGREEITRWSAARLSVVAGVVARALLWSHMACLILSPVASEF